MLGNNHTLKYQYIIQAIQLNLVVWLVSDRTPFCLNSECQDLTLSDPSMCKNATQIIPGATYEGQQPNKVEMNY